MTRLQQALWLAFVAIVASIVALLATAGYFRVVVSQSMLPTLQAGDVLVIGPSPIGYQPGMIVTYQHTQKVITHRIIGVEPDGLVTQGDANPQPDDWRTPTSAVIGIPYLRIPYLGFLAEFIRRPGGWLIFILLPAASIVFQSARQIAAEHKKAHALSRATEA